MHTSEEGLVNTRGLAKNVGTSVTLENHLTFDVLSSAANLHNYSWTLLGDMKKAQKQASEQEKGTYYSTPECFTLSSKV